MLRSSTGQDANAYLWAQTQDRVETPPLSLHRPMELFRILMGVSYRRLRN